MPIRALPGLLRAARLFVDGGGPAPILPAMSGLPPSSNAIQVCTSGWTAYALLDSGNGRKLERFGSATVIRGEPKAWWRPSLSEADWQAAGAEHRDSDGKWRVKPGTGRTGTLERGALKLEVRLGDGSKHLGVFPEQEPHWRWLEALARDSHIRSGSHRLLNLFGYTGAASLVAAAAGFHVTHVDASKPAIAWARRNQELSGLAGAPVRWILEDAFKYCRRELKRGSRYQVILLDPPSYGRGPRGELWKVDERLPELLDICRKLLADKPLGIIVTLYAVEVSALVAGQLLGDATRGLGGELTQGELALAHEKDPARLLPLSLWSRWRAP